MRKQLGRFSLADIRLDYSQDALFQAMENLKHSK